MPVKSKHPANPLKADPTRTATLRRLFLQEVDTRFLRLRVAVRRLVLGDDAFGIKRTPKLFSGVVSNTRWKFLSDREKLEKFGEWLQTEIEANIVRDEIDGWFTRYIEEGYRKGAGRAFDDVRGPLKNKTNLRFIEGQKSEFLRSAFANPESIEKVKLLASRAFTDLVNVTEAMATTMKRTILDGFVRGENALTIARELSRNVDTIGRTRARTIARTEVIRAHAEGQLDALENLGVSKIGVSVEWSTTGDTLVCPLCAPMEGVVLELAKARGLIPRHPNCRCAYVPANVGESPKDQKRKKSEIDSARDESISRERKKGSLEEKKRLSSWPGADLKVPLGRPKNKFLQPPSKTKVPKKQSPKPTPKVAPTPTPTPTPPSKVSFPISEQEELRRLLKHRDLGTPFDSGDLRRLQSLETKAASYLETRPKALALSNPDNVAADRFLPWMKIEDRVALHEGLEEVRKEVLLVAEKTAKARKEIEREIDRLYDAYDKVITRRQELLAEFERNNPGLSTSKAWDTWLSTKEYKTTQQEVAKITEKQNLLQSRLDRISSKQASARESLKLNSRHAIKNEVSIVENNEGHAIGLNNKKLKKGPPSDQHRKKTEEASDFVSSVTRKRDEGTSITAESVQLENHQRAFYWQKDRAIFCNEFDDVGTYVHELGHWLEYNIDVRTQNLVNEFLDMRIARAGTKDESLRKLFGGYDDWEVGNKDDFGKLWGEGSSSPYYVGKRYSDRATTEVLSMGIQLLYEDPVRFAEVDPEYFKFIVGVLRGEL